MSIQPTKWIVVNREQYQAFLQSYPRQLIKQTTAKGPYSPTRIIHTDDTLGDWPHNIVARSTVERQQQVSWDIRDMISIRS